VPELVTETPPDPTYARGDGELLVGGIPVTRLAERVGRTPFFAYDRTLLTGRVRRLSAALPPDLEISYAVKANPMPALVQHLSSLVDSLDVASGGEMRVALDTPLPASQISFAGPGKSPAELRQAVAAGVLVELESPTEAVRIVKAGDDLGIRPQVAVRVNPDFEVKGSGMRMGGGSQQFGIDVEQVPLLLKQLADLDIDVHGFHLFAGSQNLRADLLADVHTQTVDTLLRLCDDAPGEVRYLNIGGGFGIPYYANEHPLDLAVVGDNLHRLVSECIRPVHPQARVVLELGRYLVGEAGVYVTRVVDRKESRGQTFIVVDGGMHHQMAASGNFGQVIRRNYPLIVGNRVDEEPREVAQVVGCLCTPLDLLGDKVLLPRADIGDLVVLHQAGAYGLTASPTAFLSHPAAVEVLV
jgi:diaminopimelate decarboxylase